jgi:hypothetical protein
MVQNECEFRITDDSVKKFEKSLDQIKLLGNSEIESRKLKLQEIAIESILLDLREQLSEYNQFNKGK